jgi:hypothetical protein
MARKKRESSGEGSGNTKDKAANFQKLATARTNKALKALRQIKHLANPTAYTYTEDQVTRIVETLSTAVTEIRNTFDNPKAKQSEGFSL